jgi:MFS family permease
VPLQPERRARPGLRRISPLRWITASAFATDLRTVLAEQNFRRLFSVRLISQTGDGIVTAAIGSYVFFNAETFTSPAAAAVAFTVLYLPYSLIGPFAGVLIDRWSRRQILALSALVRSVFVVLTAVLMASGNRSVPLYAAYLLVLGVNRFFLASLSAALPHVVPADKLVMANSVSPTAGGIMALIGGLVAGGLNAATGDTERGAAITMLVAGGCYLAAGLVATATMNRDLLGPVRKPGAPRSRLLRDLAAVAAELAAGARYALRRRGPATALGATGGNKFLYGILFVMSILLYRNYFYRSSASVAEAHYLVLASVSGIGYFCAALVIPPTARRLSKPTIITLLLVVCAVTTAAFGETFDPAAFLAFGFFLYLTSQGVAICATTILQEDVEDDYRGRMFAFYDVMFNVTIAAGALISVAFLPRTGKSPAAIGAVAAAYALVAAGYWLLARQPATGGRPGTSSPSAAAHSSSS